MPYPVSHRWSFHALPCVVATWLVCLTSQAAAAPIAGSSVDFGDEHATVALAKPADPPPRLDAPPRTASLGIEGATLRNELGLLFTGTRSPAVHDPEVPEDGSPLALVLSGRVAFLKRFELAVAVPLVAGGGLEQVGSDLRARGAGLGNLTLGLKFALLGSPWHGVEVATFVRGTLPTFLSYLGQEHGHTARYAALRPGLALGWRWGRLSLQGDISALFEYRDIGDAAAEGDARNWLGFLPSAPRMDPPANGQNSLLVGASASYRVLPWLSPLVGVQLRQSLTEGREAGTLLRLLGGLRANFGKATFFELVTRYAPQRHATAREELGVHMALGVQLAPESSPLWGSSDELDAD